MNQWNNFAKTNPYYYIDTNFKGESFEFWQRGIQQADLIMKNITKTLPQNTVLDFGCGLGRVLLPMSKYFTTSIGVDVSSEMIKLLNQHAVNQKCTVKSYLTTENWQQHQYDLIYSVLTFQHIENFELIKNYIQQIAKNLNKGGIAYLHFDTRPENWFYKLKNKLPNWLLPRNHQPGIRRIRRNRKDLVKLFKKNKLKFD